MYATSCGKFNTARSKRWGIIIILDEEAEEKVQFNTLLHDGRKVHEEKKHEPVWICILNFRNFINSATTLMQFYFLNFFSHFQQEKVKLFSLSLSLWFALHSNSFIIAWYYCHVKILEHLRFLCAFSKLCFFLCFAYTCVNCTVYVCVYSFYPLFSIVALNETFFVSSHTLSFRSTIIYRFS